MAHVITSLCLRDGGCATVCPVECIVPGFPIEDWPLFYIDPDTCIDCGACVPECPFSAIFPEDEVPSAYKAKGGEHQSKPAGSSEFTATYAGTNHDGASVHLESTRTLTPGMVLDLTPDISTNASFFKSGPGYNSGK